MDVTNGNTKTAPACPPGLHWREVDLYYAYIQLSNQQKRLFEDLLLDHLLFRKQIDVYRKSTKLVKALRNKIGLELSKTTSDKMAYSWLKWACGLSEGNRPQAFLDLCVHELLGHLVRARLREQNLQLGAGAEDSGASISSLLGLRCCGSALDRVYGSLPNHHRRAIEDLLLGHVFMPHGVNAYGGNGSWNYIERTWSSDQLEWHVGRSSARAWKQWAANVAGKAPLPLDCRNEVLTMLKSLISIKSAEKRLLSETENEHQQERSAGRRPTRSGRRP